MNEQENTKIAEQMYETFNGGDIEGFMNLFSDDVRWETLDVENLPLEMKFTGRDNLAKFISEIVEYEDHLKIEPKEFIAQGDKVVILGDWLVRSKKTGKEYTSDFAHIIEVKDGKAVSFKEFFDNAAAGKAHSAAKAA